MVKRLSLLAFFVVFALIQGCSSSTGGQSVSTSGQQPIVSHCLNGQCPRWQGDDSGDEIVLRQLFAAQVVADDGAQLPRWVAYRLVGDGVGVASLLPREWQVDELVSDARDLSLDDDARTRIFQPDLSDSQDRAYRLTEVTLLAAEQGRLAPMTGFSATPYWDELNLLSNRGSLPSALRLGPWSRLDQALNEFIMRQDLPETGLPPSVFVVSGPLPAGKNSRRGFFKVAVFGNKIAAFAFPLATEIHLNYCDFEADLEAIEAESNLTLFPVEIRDRSLSESLGCRG